MSFRETLALKFVAVMFVCMGIMAYMQPDEGYTKAQVAGMNALVASLDSPRFKTRQAAVMAELWNITDEELAKPIQLWRK